MIAAAANIVPIKKMLSFFTVAFICTPSVSPWFNFFVFSFFAFLGFIITLFFKLVKQLNFIVNMKKSDIKSVGAFRRILCLRTKNLP